MQKLKNILISQPKPEAGKSPYYDIEKKHNLKMEFRKFFQVVPVLSKDFRKDRITITDYSAIILNSRNAIDHLFRICDEMRVKLSQETKFFCSSEAIALYLQKYTQYRKRKVFFSSDNSKSLQDLLLKHKDERYLWPCSDIHQDDLPEFLDKHGFKYDKAVIYRTVSSDFAGVNIYEYDAILFFSPAGIKSLFENFPKFHQGDILVGTMGHNTAHAAEEAGLKVQLKAPTPESPSMVKALENYLSGTYIEPKPYVKPEEKPVAAPKVKARPVTTTEPVAPEKPAASKPAPAPKAAAKPAAKTTTPKAAAPKAVANKPVAKVAAKPAAKAKPITKKAAPAKAKPATKKPAVKAKPVAKPQSGKKPMAKAKPAAKPVAKIKPVAKKAAPVKAKAVAKKPVAKAKPVAKKPVVKKPIAKANPVAKKAVAKKVAAKTKPVAKKAAPKAKPVAKKKKK